jgi:hypothetical protein
VLIEKNPRLEHGEITRQLKVAQGRGDEINRAAPSTLPS